MPLQAVILSLGIFSKRKIIKKNTTPTKSELNTESALNSADRLAVHLAQTAWRVALPFLVLAIGGIMLDRTLGSEPLFSIAGVLLAVVVVSVVIYRYVDEHFPETFKKG